jgi:type II secretory pathway component GspD/PulD (secretin)
MRVAPLSFVLFFSAMPACAVDIPPNQVLIEARIAEARCVNLTGQYGFDMSVGQAQLNFNQDRLGVITGHADVTLSPSLQLISIPLVGQYGISGNRLATVKINGRTESPEPASIKIQGSGDISGFTLNVTARVDSARERVTLNIEPTIQEFGLAIDGITTTGQTENQVFGTGQLKLPGQSPVSVLTRQTFFRDKNGNITGGLFESDGDEFNARIPYLGNLPVVGELLKSKIKNGRKQNIIIISPSIVQFTTQP